MKNLIRYVALVAILSVGSAILISQGTGTPNTLRVRTDANGYLLAAGAAQTNPITTSTFANTRLRTDASGNLLVATTAGTWSGLQTFPDGIAVTGSMNTATNGIAVTSTDGMVLSNNTASTAAIPVQQSPRLRFRSQVWNTTVTAANNTNDWFIESLPASATTPSGALNFRSSLNGAASTLPLSLLSSGFASFAGSVSISTTGSFQIASRNRILSAADGLTGINNTNQSTGIQINVGTAAPTLTSCGTGTVTAHSTNTAGEVTATGATACTVTFGLPNWSFQPFCVVNNRTTDDHILISAISTTAMTVSGLTSGDKFTFICLGGSV